MTITLKPLSSTDFDILKKIYRSTREAELTANNWNEEQKTRFIEFQFNAQHAHYLSTFKGAELNIILLKRKTIGRLYVWETETQIRLIDISILPEYKNKGIGTRILKDLIKRANKAGKVLNLHVAHHNPALKLYERFGFKTTEDTGAYYFMERMPESNS